MRTVFLLPCVLLGLMHAQALAADPQLVEHRRAEAFKENAITQFPRNELAYRCHGKLSAENA